MTESGPHRRPRAQPTPTANLPIPPGLMWDLMVGDNEYHGESPKWLTQRKKEKTQKALVFTNMPLRESSSGRRRLLFGAINKACQTLLECTFFKLFLYQDNRSHLETGWRDLKVHVRSWNRISRSYLARETSISYLDIKVPVSRYYLDMSSWDKKYFQTIILDVLHHLPYTSRCV